MLNTLRKGLSIVIMAALLLTGVATPSEASSKHAGSSRHKLFQTSQTAPATGELIVTYKNGTSAKKVSGKFTQLRSEERIGNTELVKVTSGNLEEVAKEIAQDPNVAYVEPNYVYHVTETTSNAVNDKLFKQQWGLPAVDAPNAWDKLANWQGAKSDQVIVAVVDTGVASDHPDLAGRVLSKGYNTIDDNENTTDYFGHGTHVAGIIAAQTNNKRGVAGVAGTANVKVLPIKVLGDDGFGTSLSIAKGIDKAVELGADVINMSLGGQGHSRLMEEAIHKATEKGIVVVVAAGNSGDNAEGYFPAGYAEPITVASINDSLQASDFSNYGSPIDIAAPGEQVVSTVPDQQYEAYDGTSMATPFVAGAAALVKLTHPDWNVDQVRHALENTAKDIDQTGFDASTGHGLLQVAAALSYQDQDSLHVLAPSQGNQVFGQVPFQLTVRDRQVTQIQLANEQGKLVGSYPVVNQKANFDWDSTQVADGRQRITIRALNASNQLVGKAEQLQLIVKNSQQHGVKVQVINPDGQPSGGAVLQVVRLDDRSNEEWESSDGFNTIFSTYVNQEGFVYIPSSVLLKNEKYAVLIQYIDIDHEQQYVQFQALKGTAETIQFDLRKTTQVQVQVGDQAKAYPTNNTLYFFVPIIHGSELTPCTITAATDEQGKVNVRIPAGEYQAYAVRNDLSGQNYVLKQRIQVDSSTSTIRFDLADTTKLTASLPKWVSSALVYLDQYPFSDIGYMIGLPLSKSQPIVVSKQLVNFYSIDLFQEVDDQVLIYSLESLDGGLDLTKNQRISIPATAKLQVYEDSEEEDGQVYQPGEDVFLPFGVEFGSKYRLQYLERSDSLESFQEKYESAYLVRDKKKNSLFFLPRKQGFLSVHQEKSGVSSDELTPYIIMNDSKGKEVYRVPSMNDFTVPSNYNMEDGLYTLVADFSAVPVPVAPKQAAIKQIKVEMAASTDTQVNVISPTGKPFMGVFITAFDDQNQEVSSDGYFDFFGDGTEQASVSLPQLQVGKTYTFAISGMLMDSTPLLLERKVKIRGSELTLDFSQKSTKPTRLELPRDRSVYYEISNEHGSIANPISSSIRYAWIDPGAYQLKASKTKGKEQFFYTSQLVIQKEEEKLQLHPDLKKMKKVSITGGKKNATWLLGVSSSEEEEDSYEETYSSFKITPGDTLYLEPGDYQFELGRMEQEDDSTTIFMYDTKPVSLKAGYEFKVDPKLTVQLKPDEPSYLPGEEVTVTVNVQDRYHNRLKEVVVIVDEPSAKINAPLKITRNKAGKLTFLAYDENKREYAPISSQEVRPQLSLVREDTVMDLLKDPENWNEAILTIPSDAAAGVYTLKWLANLPTDLIGEKEIEVREE